MLRMLKKEINGEMVVGVGVTPERLNSLYGIAEKQRFHYLLKGDFKKVDTLDKLLIYMNYGKCEEYEEGEIIVFYGDEIEYGEHIMAFNDSCVLADLIELEDENERNEFLLRMAGVLFED